jgi:nicotinamide-nucleotide amidase
VIVELIAVGSELLRHGRTDTNSDWLTERVQAAGGEVTVRCAVDDDATRLAEVVRGAWERSDAVLLTGGLGPTDDDRTREGLARAFGLSLEMDDGRAERLRRLYGRYGRSFGAAEARQAMRPQGAEWIDNPLGSAAGLLIERDRRVLAALPGVPAEMRAMFEAAVLPRLQRLSSGRLGRRSLKIAGRTEGSIERQLHDLYASPGLDVTVLGGIEGLELHARARGRDAADVAEKLQSFESEVRRRLGKDLFGGGDDRLSSVVGALLLERGRTVATAESCTAGLLGAALTSVPGSSAWYRGGLVVYENELKRSLAGVHADTLASEGAVSERVARELAAGARERCGAEVGVGLTGIAGPGGGSPDKPVGLIHLAIQDGTDSLHWKLRLIGDRETVRARAVVVALDRLRRRLLESA